MQMQNEMLRASPCQGKWAFVLLSDIVKTEQFKKERKDELAIIVFLQPLNSVCSQ